MTDVPDGATEVQPGDLIMRTLGSTEAMMHTGNCGKTRAVLVCHNQGAYLLNEDGTRDGSSYSYGEVGIYTRYPPGGSPLHYAYPAQAPVWWRTVEPGDELTVRLPYSYELRQAGLWNRPVVVKIHQLLVEVEPHDPDVHWPLSHEQAGLRPSGEGPDRWFAFPVPPVPAS